MNKREDTERFWKFIKCNDGVNQSYFGRQKWELNKWYQKKGKLEMCVNGYHCSTNIADAMSYGNGRILAEVEISGKCMSHDTKICCERMKIINTVEMSDCHLLELVKVYCQHALDNWKVYELGSQVSRINSYLNNDKYMGFGVGKDLNKHTRTVVSHQGTKDQSESTYGAEIMYIEINDSKIHDLFLSNSKNIIHKKAIEIIGRMK